jgi:hypothetical protein
MKKLATGLVAVLFAFAALGGENEHQVKKNALLEQLKPLAGTWEGSGFGKTMRTVFTVGSAGSTVVENMAPGTEHSMLNVIHADGDALLYTHFCAGGSQPRFKATKFDGNSIAFKFHDGTNVAGEFMSGVTLTLVDADHLVEEWSTRKDGKEQSWKFEFARVK